MASVRISRVKFKAGGEIHLLRPSVHEGRARVERDVRDTLDQHFAQAGLDIAGCAFVVWDADFASTVAVWNGPASPMASITLPDFLRNRVLGAKIEDWTLGTINQQNGYGPEGAS